MFGFFKRKNRKSPQTKEKGCGLLLFDSTSEVIRAENLLKEHGWDIKVMGPPPEIQKGCDLVIEFPLMEKLHLERLLGEAGNPPLEVVPVSSPLLSPVDLYHVTDFGQYLMVRAANMKITVDKSDLTIVNISGGGCPDVPYLAAELTGKTLAQAPRPRKIGHTLCGYALELAFAEMERLCSPS